MAYILDIIFAMAVGGTILVIILNSNDLAVRAQSESSGNMQVQRSLTQTTQSVEGEFRNMGYNVPDTVTSVILYANRTSITFLEDNDANGTIDTVYYSLGPAGELYYVQNDSIRLLHRKVGANGSDGAVGLVTTFKLRYFPQSSTDTLPTPVASVDLGAIELVEMTIEVQNPYALYRRPNEVVSGQRNALYSSSMWRQTRLASQNLRR